jgi:hypothetical protein
MFAPSAYLRISPIHLSNIFWYESNSVSLLQVLQLTTVILFLLIISAFLPQKMQIIFSSIVNSIPKLPRAFECDDLSAWKHQVSAGGRVSASSLALFMYAEFTESAN